QDGTDTALVYGGDVVASDPWPSWSAGATVSGWQALANDVQAWLDLNASAYEDPGQPPESTLSADAYSRAHAAVLLLQSELADLQAALPDSTAPTEPGELGHFIPYQAYVADTLLPVVTAADEAEWEAWLWGQSKDDLESLT